jgi:hypothetical protein
MIRKVKNGMSTGGRSCGGKSVNPTSLEVKLSPIRLPENGDLDLVVVGLGGRVGDREQDLTGRLLVVPAALDRREFHRLVIVHVIAGQVSEEDLDRHEHGREKQSHAQHDVRLGVELAAQQVPRPRRGDTEGAGNI